MGLFQCAPYGNDERSVIMSIMWHVALEPGKTSMQDVILADISADDFDTICCLVLKNDGCHRPRALRED